MRTTLIVLAAGAMLALPLIGNVQQVPGESTRKPPAAADLQTLIAAQTEAIAPAELPDERARAHGDRGGGAAGVFHGNSGATGTSRSR